jgi:hypothetical protein
MELMESGGGHRKWGYPNPKGAEGHGRAFTYSARLERLSESENPAGLLKGERVWKWPQL